MDYESQCLNARMMWNDRRTPRIHTKIGTCLVENTANQQMHHILNMCIYNSFMLTATSHSTKIWIMSILWCETIGQLWEYTWKLIYYMSKTQPISTYIYTFHVCRYTCFMQLPLPCARLGYAPSNMRRTHTGSETICKNLERVEAIIHLCFGTIEHSQLSAFTFCRDLLFLTDVSICMRWVSKSDQDGKNQHSPFHVLYLPLK